MWNPRTCERKLVVFEPLFILGPETQAISPLVDGTPRKHSIRDQVVIPQGGSGDSTTGPSIQTWVQMDTVLSQEDKVAAASFIKMNSDRPFCTPMGNFKRMGSLNGLTGNMIPLFQRENPAHLGQKTSTKVLK